VTLNARIRDAGVNAAQREDVNIPPRLTLEGVTVRYGDVMAMQHASLTVDPGTVMALVGPSGCGKSSLLAAINRLTESIPHCRVSGRVLLDAEDVSAAPSLRELRRRIGMVFQQPNPFPLSIFENVAFPLRERGQRDRHELAARVERALRHVGLWSEVQARLDQSALMLSGGQQQRLCFARALALEPSVLLLDEPCSALDPVAMETIEQLIVSLKGRYTMLMVTHNLAQARRIADGVTVCWVDGDCGCVVETGCRTLFDAARNPVTRRYLTGAAG
jgi:phosphate transport system ATP-binding protein